MTSIDIMMAHGVLVFLDVFRRHDGSEGVKGKEESRSEGRKGPKGR